MVIATKQKATKSPTVKELYWAAGLLEGEGCFNVGGHPILSATEHIACAMTDREPVEKLLHLFGGSFGSYTDKKRLNHRLIWRWQVHGKRARGIMYTLYVLLSPRRQAQIKAALVLKRYSRAS